MARIGDREVVIEEIEVRIGMIVVVAETDEEVVVAAAAGDHTELNGLSLLIICPRGAGNTQNPINRLFDTFSVVYFAVDKPSDVSVHSIAHLGE